MTFFLYTLISSYRDLSFFFYLDFVSSDTILGDGIHPSGAVVAEIVKANIPVRNGVVHLISRPLMVVDNTVKQFVEVH